MTNRPQLERPSSRCDRPEDVGRIEYSADQNIWFECMFDARAGRYSWVIIPPTDDSLPTA